MTVIDYLPVGKEVWPNVLLSQTKKCIISKVTACFTGFLALNELELKKKKLRKSAALRLPAFDVY